FDIAELFVQRLDLLNVGRSDGNRNRVVVAFAAWFYRRRVVARRMALYHFNHLINQLRFRQTHYFVGKWGREFKQFVKFGFHVSSGVTSKRITPTSGGSYQDT